MVTFVVRGGIEAARKFIIAARSIPFCPSLGEVSTTLSHPESTSHRSVSPLERAALGIGGGMIRLSVGTEDVDFLKLAIENGLREVA
jgi:cystathionine beta-lyase/cystathionine gamma-synthase